MMGVLCTVKRRFDRCLGASPAENRFYTLIMFDISGRKKYSLLTKLLKRYSRRIQNSVYEAYLKPSDIKQLTEKIERLMGSERYFDPSDKIRIYQMSGSCSAVMFGDCACSDDDTRSNIFI